MKLSLSSDGSGIVRLPSSSNVVQVTVFGTPTTAYSVIDGVGIQFSPIPPVGFPLEVTYEEDVQMVGVENAALKVTSPLYSKRYEVVDTTTSYLGEATVGSSTSSPVWRIQKLTFGADGDLTILFANGSTEFNQVWADRASLSYS